jgi:hypothetical protein
VPVTSAGYYHHLRKARASPAASYALPAPNFPSSYCGENANSAQLSFILTLFQEGAEAIFKCFCENIQPRVLADSSRGQDIRIYLQNMRVCFGKEHYYVKAITMAFQILP